MIWYDLLEESQCQEQQFDSTISGVIITHFEPNFFLLTSQGQRLSNESLYSFS